jgi:hypothetical protein
LITYTFVNRKEWVKLQLTFFSSSTLSPVYYVSVWFVVLTAAFRRIQVVCVDGVSLCEWFPTFRTWVLRSYAVSFYIRVKLPSECQLMMIMKWVGLKRTGRVLWIPPCPSLRRGEMHWNI